MTNHDRTHFISDNVRGQLAPPVWPLPSLDGTSPIITSAGKRQPFVQLGYPEGVEVPSLVPVFCVGNGEVQYSGPSGIIIDHKNGFATYYAHLDHKFVIERRTASRKRYERVNVGDVLGYVTLPFQFEVWRLHDHHDYGPLNPAEHLPNWAVIPYDLKQTSLDAQAA